MYGTLGLLAGRASFAAAGAAALPFWAPVVGVAGLGAFDEWHQQFVPRRSMDLADWIADAAGGAAGVAVAALLRRRRRAASGADEIRGT